MDTLDWGGLGSSLRGNFLKSVEVDETQEVAETRGVAGKNSCLWLARFVEELKQDRGWGKWLKVSGGARE